MPRSALLARLHEAWYDVLTATEDEASRLRTYQLQLEACCREWDCSISELQEAVRGDFGKWMKEQGLPKPPRRD